MAWKKSGSLGVPATITDPLKGKKLGVFGSSSSDESFGSTIKYYRAIANRTGLVANSVALAGSAAIPTTADYTADTGSNVLKQIDALPVDLDFVVGQPGVNDERFAASLGTFSSTATSPWDFYSTLHKMCQKMLDKWPTKPLGIITGQYIGNPAVGLVTAQTSAYHDAILEVCRYYGIPAIDLAKEGRTPYSYQPFKTTYVNVDGLHLTDAGNLILSYPVEAYYRKVLGV